MIVTHPSGHVDIYESEYMISLRESLESDKSRIDKHIAAIDAYLVGMSESISQPPEPIL